MGVYGGPDIITDGLVLALDAGSKKSYPGSGTTWYDLSGNNNGILTNGPVFNTDDNGYFSFDYTNDCVLVSNMNSVSYSNGITTDIWYYNGGGTGRYRGIVNNGDSDFRFGGFDIRLGREDYYGGSNNGTKLNTRITCGVESLANSYSITTYAERFEWHNYVTTYDNTTIRLYKDGQLFDSATHSIGGSIVDTGNSTTIGLSPGTSEYLDGRLSSIKIHNKALTAQEVLQNYNATKSRFI
jgi:hypothetical protein